MGFCEDKKNMHDVTEEKGWKTENGRKKLAGMGTAVTNPPYILKMYVS